MSQRNSEYARVERDLYETPEWVTEALIPHIPMRRGESWLPDIWEPACGNGTMVSALRDAGYEVWATDVIDGEDFLFMWAHPDCDMVITNPPYSLAREFIEHALDLMEEPRGAVAMLLRTDFDHAKTRRHLFADCPQFAKKLVLTKRIVWFERKGAAPSFNHAWFIWDWKHEGPPVLAYHV